MIDILLSTYNGERFLVDLFNSLCNQTFRNWKLIVRDDGSEDKTLEIILEQKKKLGERLSILSDNKKIGFLKCF